MTEGSVSFTLDGGESLTIPDEDLRPVRDLLWGMEPTPGAASTAAVVHAAYLQHPGLFRTPYELTATQSNVLREAVAALSTAP